MDIFGAILLATYTLTFILSDLLGGSVPPVLHVPRSIGPIPRGQLLPPGDTARFLIYLIGISN